MINLYINSRKRWWKKSFCEFPSSWKLTILLGTMLSRHHSTGLRPPPAVHSVISILSTRLEDCLITTINIISTTNMTMQQSYTITSPSSPSLSPNLNCVMCPCTFTATDLTTDHDSWEIQMARHQPAKFLWADNVVLCCTQETTCWGLFQPLLQKLLLWLHFGRRSWVGEAFGSGPQEDDSRIIYLRSIL
jgi:hypothetical protein